jgi:opacity protein-like surface antigen
MKTWLALASLALLALPATAAAQDQTAPAPGAQKDRGAVVAGGKVGGIASFNGLGPFVTGTVEVGYVFPWLNRGLGLYVDAAYTVPRTSGSGVKDPRLESSSYGWTLTQKELPITPTVVYRLTKLGRVVPYIGIGPRIYMLESITEGKAGNSTILQTKERSTKFGGAIPVGVDIKVGPGAFLAELLFEIGPLDHALTGKTNTAAGTLQLGYRLML